MARVAGNAVEVGRVAVDPVGIRPLVERDGLLGAAGGSSFAEFHEATPWATDVPSTSHTANWPDTVNAGDLLILHGLWNANNTITMKVKPKVAAGQINLAGLPEEKTTETETDVILQDGQGIVIGGLIKEKDNDDQKKIPFFGNLPYVGMLFQAREKESERTEVVIALLPRVLPYAPCPAAREQLEMHRATTPLFHGPLRRCPRPWEPSLRDALPRRGDRL